MQIENNLNINSIIKQINKNAKKEKYKIRKNSQ